MASTRPIYGCLMGRSLKFGERERESESREGGRGRERERMTSDEEKKEKKNMPCSLSQLGF